MQKSFVHFFFFIFISSVTIAQEHHSLQVSGGVVFPRFSSNGLSGAVQYNYPVSEQINLYSYASYSAWDKHYVTYSLRKSAMGQDDHMMFSAFLGSKINFHSNSFMTSFITLEAGYSHMEFNSYGHTRAEVSKNATTEIEYYPDYSTKKENKEDLFGIGIGAGLLHPLSDASALVFTYRLNTYTNSNFQGFFTNRGTISSVSAGFNFYL